MNVELKKLELISWIARLKNYEWLDKLLQLKEAEEGNIESKSTRKMGFGKGTFTYIADDFDAPLDEFWDYMP